MPSTVPHILRIKRRNGAANTVRIAVLGSATIAVEKLIESKAKIFSSLGNWNPAVAQEIFCSAVVPAKGVTSPTIVIVEPLPSDGGAD